MEKHSFRGIYQQHTQILQLPFVVFQYEILCSLLFPNFNFSFPKLGHFSLFRVFDGIAFDRSNWCLYLCVFVRVYVLNIGVSGKMIRAHARYFGSLYGVLPPDSIEFFACRSCYGCSMLLLFSLWYISVYFVYFQPLCKLKDGKTQPTTSIPHVRLSNVADYFILHLE